MRSYLLTSLLIWGTMLTTSTKAQDTLPSSKAVISNYLDRVLFKITSLDKSLDKQIRKALQGLQRQDEKIKSKLKNDKLKARSVLEDANWSYNQFEQRLVNPGFLQQYIPSLDTLNCSLNFLQQNPQQFSLTKDLQEKLKEALARVRALEKQFQKAEEVKRFIEERSRYLKNQLGAQKVLEKLNRQVYYYSRQINEYKSLLDDHKKAERKAIELLINTKLFNDFMQKNSLMASLFRLPSGSNEPLDMASLAGLQTREQIGASLQNQIGTGGLSGQQHLQQNIQLAQSKLNELKEQMNRFGSGSSTEVVPGGFKPNHQKTKSFLQRLELGVNVQSQKRNAYFPVTSDVGGSVGYKLNDKSTIGIGASYKIGWGKPIRQISITHQGVGLRSFLDWKIKGSFWLSAGYETNHRNEFKSVDELKNLNEWQQSGLIGISKVVSLRTRIFKKVKLQLMWDYLSYRQGPATQPILFRIGYATK